MFSLTALLASLPPANLVETDLPRFVAVALGRRTKAELPGLRALLSEETLRGYPPSLGPILLGAVEQLIARGVDPATLDARMADAILGSEGFVVSLEQRVPLAFRRQRLRPGTAVTPALRTTLGSRLVILPGVGPQLVLLLPIDLAQVADTKYAMPLGPVLARPATADEADVLRSAWGVIEEAVGLTGPEAERYQSRFFAIARRENHDAAGAKNGLQGMAVDARMTLWEAVVAHWRDQELPEQHRPGRRGLDRRLAQLGLELDLPWVAAVVSLAESAYRTAGFDPEVVAGRPPCTHGDLATWTKWVDVPAAGRDRVGAMEPLAIEHLLVVLAEHEAGRVDRPLDEGLRRPLQSLRDQVLKPRWARSRWQLAGCDPLLVADTRIALGEDLNVIKREVEALAEEARRERPRSGAVVLPLPIVNLPKPVLEVTQITTTKVVEIVDEPRPLPPSTRPKFELPPMPSAPPPRARPRTRPRDDFPPMPSAPPPRPIPPREPLPPRIQRPPTAPAPAPARAPAAVPARTNRTQTAPHLVTPAQGNDFYDQSFRELEVIERDLVQRGPFPSAEERVEAIAREAAHLHAALGPSARSGDRDFIAALARIEKVQAYLERMRPLVRGEAPPLPTNDPEPKPKGFLGKLFGRKASR